MKKLYYLSVILFFVFSCQDSTSEEALSFEEKLNQISAINYEKRSSKFPGYTYYFLTIKQAVDHNNKALGTFFSQRVRILLKNTELPVVFMTNGYSLRSEKKIALHEITEKLNANQIEVEHRYFSKSKPEQIDWSTLTIKQAATDHHNIINMLKPLLSGKWISTGKSKGGMTASYHRRFFPDDLAGTVAYVAPLSLSLWDERFTTYSLSVVNQSSIDKYKAYQRQALLKIDSLVILLDSWAKQNGHSVSDSKYSTKARLEAEIALSWIIASSWYPDMNSKNLPSTNDGALAYLEYIYKSGAFTFLTTSGLKSQYPYHVHAAKELGNFSAPLDHIKDLLTTDVKDFGLNFPTFALPNFKAEVMQDIYNWAENDAKNIIFIYGQEDIFTGGAYPVKNDPARGTQIHIEPGIHNIEISNLSLAAQEKIYSALNQWVGK